MEESDKSYWEQFLNQEIEVSMLVSGNKPRYYKGTVKAVYEEKLLLEDRKKGELQLCFNGLSRV